MLTSCIACSKQTVEDGRKEGRPPDSGTPSTKEAVKSLTLQIKDLSSKFSGAYRRCKPYTGCSSDRRKPRAYPVSSDSKPEGVQYPYIEPASSSSTPAWDFSSGSRHLAKRSDNRPIGAFNYDRTWREPQSAFATSRDGVLEDEDEPKEWMAQVEPGVHITFISLPNGGNDLKRMRFSREIFNKWQAQRWWGENYDRIMELYNVHKFNHQALSTPPRSEDEYIDSSYTRLSSARESPMVPYPYKDSTQKPYYRSPKSNEYNTSDQLEQGVAQSLEASRMTTSSRDESSVSISNASDVEAEWVEQDEPGVYITIRQLRDGTRELRRVRFSRERFSEVRAKTWWEDNRKRIEAQYL